MAKEEVDLRVEGLDGIKVLGRAFETKGVDILLRDAIHDIASRIEFFAKDFAPEGDEEDHHEDQIPLKEHPVDVQELSVGRVETRAPLFVKKGVTPGSLFAIQGPGGFQKGGAPAGGKVVGFVEITVADNPVSAKFVHYGTPPEIVSPTGRNMIFKWHGHWHKRKMVSGQRPNPFLTLAAEEVQYNYVPRRVRELKEAIASIT